MARVTVYLPIIPTFVLPYKRYAGPTLLSRAVDYVENSATTYRQTVIHDGSTTGYVRPPGSSAGIDERALDHSTVWRMLTWLGCQLPALAVGRQQIQQHNPSSTCHRFRGAVGPHKFRSPQREQFLCRSRQLLHLAAEWEEYFEGKFIPRYATRSGFH